MQQKFFSLPDKVFLSNGDVLLEYGVTDKCSQSNKNLALNLDAVPVRVRESSFSSHWSLFCSNVYLDSTCSDSSFDSSDDTCDKLFKGERNRISETESSVSESECCKSNVTPKYLGSQKRSLCTFAEKNSYESDSHVMNRAAGSVSIRRVDDKSMINSSQLFVSGELCRDFSNKLTVSNSQNIEKCKLLSDFDQSEESGIEGNASSSARSGCSDISHGNCYDNQRSANSAGSNSEILLNPYSGREDSFIFLDSLEYPFDKSRKCEDESEQCEKHSSPLNKAFVETNVCNNSEEKIPSVNIHMSPGTNETNVRYIYQSTPIKKGSSSPVQSTNIDLVEMGEPSKKDEKFNETATVLVASENNLELHKKVNQNSKQYFSSGNSSRSEDKFYSDYFTSNSVSSSSDSFFSVAEEYKYVDKGEGVILRERRLFTEPVRIPGVLENSGLTEMNDHHSSSESLSLSIASSLNIPLDYDTDTLRKELEERGCNPGPITKTTKRVYLRKLMKLTKGKETCFVELKSNEYKPELERSLKSMAWIDDLSSYIKLEEAIIEEFSNPVRKWRGGITKTAFCYLLLDPRKTRNLPSRADKLSPLEAWTTFVSSIFYVGKGVRSRPYAHLYQATSVWNQNSSSSDKKVRHILDIWGENLGVVCLQIFQNVISVEAYTREAAMIQALGLNNLKNARNGEYYGIAASWPPSQKRKLGVYLLYRSFMIFLHEGERQLRPENI